MTEPALATPTRPRQGTERPTVLFICHNHPSVRPGGAEAYALELHRHMHAAGALEPVFLAKGGPPLASAGRVHLGTCVAPVEEHPDEYFFFTEDWNGSYDWTYGTVRGDKRLYTKHFRAFLAAIKPDVVHLQHTMFFGYDILREIKNTAPQAAIVYTLHEFMPICHRQGQMLRATDEQPCMHASPRRCNECFPEIDQQTFFLRKKFVQSHLSLVDLFIAPSEFLGQRYIDWGIPAEKVLVEEYGRTSPPGHASVQERTHRDRFGFFGQLTPFKGLQVLLEAIALAHGQSPERPDPLIEALERASGSETSGANQARTPQPTPHVRVHGANLDLQPGQFQNRVKDLLERAGDAVTFVGRYDHDQLWAMMSEIDWVIVPSIWWENSPLVIQEAFHFGRPVICSDIGGMAEKVTDGVDGLHFRANDPTSLAATIRRAAETPGLWERLRSNIKPVYGMTEHADRLHSIYDELLLRRSASDAH
jgi:glycosyltransferase involved in cell wall biosynthesis